MAGRTIVVDPMTRIEGHLRFETSVDNGVVVDSRCSGDMFRGIEKALIGYDARVAQQVTQRVCGVCPYAHAEAAALALESAMGLKPNPNGILLRNLTIGAYQLQDYLLHFYALCALDFVDITAIAGYQGRDAKLLAVRDWVLAELKSNKIFPAAPFLPRYEGSYLNNKDANIGAVRNYVEAIDVMRTLQKMVALFGGKSPHPVAIEAGGVTTLPTIERVARYRSWLDQVAPFIRNSFTGDVAAVAGAFKGYFKEGRGYGNLLSYPFLSDKNGGNHAFAGGATINGSYQKLDLARITEDTRYSYYKDQPEVGVKPLQSRVLTPISQEEFERERKKDNGKYSWTRAPRYGGEVMEVGPAARVVNTYHSNTNPALNRLVDSFNKKLGVGINDYPSVMGRHLSRAIMANLMLDMMEKLIDQVEIDGPAFVEHEIPKNARGVGLTEATRGALAHWIETDDKGYIRNYEMIVPTTWNISPRDGSDKPGAVEKMLIGTRVANRDNPLELARIVRSTDPCIACSVH